MANPKIEEIIQSCYDKVKDIDYVENFIESSVIKKPIEKSSLGNGYPSILIFLAEASKYYKDEEPLNIAYKYILKLKTEIEKEGYKGGSLSIGIAGVFYSVYRVSDNCKRYKSLMKTLNNLLTKEVEKSLEKFNNMNSPTSASYDCVTRC